MGNGLAQPEGITRHASGALAVGRVQGHSAESILTTASWTGIAALLVHARQRIGTLVMAHALRPAVGRCALELRQTAALRLSTHIPALCVRTARGRRANIAHDFRRPRDRLAQSIGVSGVARSALAVGPVLNRLAYGIEAALARTRVHALVVDASVNLGTVGAGVAFQPAVGRLAKVSGQTGADGISIPLRTLGVGSTRRGLAGIGRRLRRFIANRRARHQGIARHPFGTVAHGDVVDGVAESVGGTVSRTRIHALLVHTRPVPGAVRVQHALRPTTGVGIALVFRQAGALSVVADSIGAARRRLAGIGLN